MSRCKAPFNIKYIWQGLLLLALAIMAASISRAFSNNGVAVHLVKSVLLINSSSGDLQPFQLEHGSEYNCSSIAQDSYMSGLCLIAVGNYEFARNVFSKCNTPLCRLRSGDALYLMGDATGAKNEWINLGESNFLLQRAINAFRSGNFQLASLNIEAAEDSVLIKPQSINPIIPNYLIITSNTLRDIGIDLQDSGDMENSKKAFLASLFANPQNSFAAYKLALIYHEEGDLEAAEDLLQVALLSNSISLLKAAYLEKGHLHFEQQSWKEAEKSYSDALRLSPDMDVARLWRGIVYFGLENWELARKDFRELLKSKIESIRIIAERYYLNLPYKTPEYIN